MNTEFTESEERLQPLTPQEVERLSKPFPADRTDEQKVNDLQLAKRALTISMQTVEPYRAAVARERRKMYVNLGVIALSWFGVVLAFALWVKP